MLAIRLDQNLEQRLEQLSKKTHRTKTFYVKEALSKYLDDMEDLYMIESRLEDLKHGKDKILSSEDFWNGLEN